MLSLDCGSIRRGLGSLGHQRQRGSMVGKGDEPTISFQGSSHLRFMFPSADPDSHRPVTINPLTNEPSSSSKLPQVGVTGRHSHDIVSAL